MNLVTNNTGFQLFQNLHLRLNMSELGKGGGLQSEWFCKEKNLLSCFSTWQHKQMNKMKAILPLQHEEEYQTPQQLLLIRTEWSESPHQNLKVFANLRSFDLAHKRGSLKKEKKKQQPHKDQTSDRGCSFNPADQECLIPMPKIQNRDKAGGLTLILREKNPSSSSLLVCLAVATQP